MGGNYCPDCAKLVSFDLGEPEVSDVEIDEEGRITAEMRLVLNCAECGSELKEANLTIEEEPQEIADHIEEHQEAGEDYTLEIEEGDSSMDDRFSPDKDKKGKYIPHRFRKHFYIGNLTVNVKCDCGKDWDIELSTEEQASAFEDLN